MNRLPFLKREITGFFNLYYGLITEKTPVIVYQMAKVGSSSIHNSLKIYGVRPIFHIHNFNPSSYRYGRSIYRHIIEKCRRVDFITLVREPISRNISNFFGKIYKHKYNFSLNELLQLFQNFNLGNSPLTWFDLELREVLGIDVYNYPFPKEKGSLVIAKDNFRLLILKLERDNSCIEKAIIDFLDLGSDFKLIRANISEKKEFGGVYKEFKQRLTLPQWYIDKMCDLKYFKHFYNDNEIKKVKDRYMS